MRAAPRLIYLSDLHVRSAEDPSYHRLLKALTDARAATPKAVIVLGGDVFDLFVGALPVFLRRYAEFLALVREMAREGFEIHYIEGNHDFLLKRVFADEPRIRIHPREHVLALDGKSFYLAHGDLVDRADWGYLFLRAFFRGPLIRFMVRFCPGEWLEKLGAFSARHSKGRPGGTAYTPAGMPAKQIERLRTVYRSFASEKIRAGHDFVILGHCHDLDQMRFRIGERGAHYMNAGFPPIHGSYVAWESGSDELERRPF